MDQKKFIITSLIVYVVGASAAYLGSSIVASSGSGNTSKTNVTTTAGPTVPAEPLTEECPINGAMYGKSAKAKWEKRRPLAVVIENHKESRPQSGISAADVVYEGVSEGGVTRTLSIFYCEDAEPIGPVRSARVHFVNLLREWGQFPLFAHVGGANCNEETGSGCGNGAPADAWSKNGLIAKLGWKVYNDLDQFSIPFPQYYRDYERLPGVATEHTVYASTKKLWDYAAKNRKLTNVDEDGVAWNEEWKPWKFVDEAPMGKRGKVASIEYDFYDTNVAEYGVRWAYDATTNEYSRFNGGKPHTDLNTNSQLTAHNVFVITAPEFAANDDYPGGHVVYDLTGSGDFYGFQNGEVIEGTWEKEDLDSKMVFLDGDGVEVEVVRGNVWISLLPKGNEVTFGAAPKAKATTPASKSKTTTKESTEGVE